MYRIENEAAYIRVLQNFLNIPQSGRYDTRTTQAVLLHQNQNGLQKTGKVDYKTFLSIRDAYRFRCLIREISEFKRAPYSFGAYGEDVEKLNSMLASVLPVYSIDITPPRGRYFGIDSENAVKFLKTVFRHKDDAVADSVFISRLKKEYAVLNLEK